MSVSVYINNLLDETNLKYCFPISSEKFFNSHWLPACELLKLRWIPCFGSGIVIYKEDLLEIKAEIDKLKVWARENLSDADLEYMIERLNLLDDKLPLAFTEENTSVYIG